MGLELDRRLQNVGLLPCRDDHFTLAGSFEPLSKETRALERHEATN